MACKRSGVRVPVSPPRIYGGHFVSVYKICRRHILPRIFTKEKILSLSDYQKQVDEAVQPYAKPYWDPLSQLAGMIEELGEVSRILNDKYGDKPKKPEDVHEALENELADLTFGIICLANSEGVKLDAAMQRTIDKLHTRDKDRFKKK